MAVSLCTGESGSFGSYTGAGDCGRTEDGGESGRGGSPPQQDRREEVGAGRNTRDVLRRRANRVAPAG